MPRQRREPDVTSEPGSDRSRIARFDIGAHDWRMLIGGRLVAAVGGERIDVISPATARTIATIPGAGPTDVDLAVEAARKAFASWRRVPVIERSRFVLALADAIESSGDELAYLDAVDNGSPIRVMRGDYK